MKAGAMRILITGSRNWVKPELIKEAILKTIEDNVNKEPENMMVTVVHGANPRGADSMSGEISADLGYTVETYPADWNTYGKAAGGKRNQQMVDLGADVCLAFPTEDSRGTWDCVRRAKKAGIPVTIVNSDTGDMKAEKKPATLF